MVWPRTWSLLHSLSFASLSILAADNASPVSPSVSPSPPPLMCDISIVGKTLAGMMAAARLKEIKSSLNVCIFGTSVDDSMASARQPWFWVPDKERIDHEEYKATMKLLHENANLAYSMDAQQWTDFFLNKSSEVLHALSRYTSLKMEPVKISTVSEGFQVKCKDLPSCEGRFGLIPNYGVVVCERIKQMFRRSKCCDDNEFWVKNSPFWPVENDPYQVIDASIFGASMRGGPNACESIDMLSILYRLESYLLSKNVVVRDGYMNKVVPTGENKWNVHFRTIADVQILYTDIVIFADDEFDPMGVSYKTWVADALEKSMSQVSYKSLADVQWKQRVPLLVDMFLYKGRTQVIDNLVSYRKATILFKSNVTQEWSFSENEAYDRNLRTPLRGNEDALFLYIDEKGDGFPTLKEALYHVNLQEEWEGIKRALESTNPSIPKVCDKRVTRLRYNVRRDCSGAPNAMSKEECEQRVSPIDSNIKAVRITSGALESRSNVYTHSATSSRIFMNNFPGLYGFVAGSAGLRSSVYVSPHQRNSEDIISGFSVAEEISLMI